MKIHSSRPIFTVDLEDFNHGLHIPKGDWNCSGTVMWLLFRLTEFKVKAIFYVLDRFDKDYPGLVDTIRELGHIIKSHGENHYRWEEADRKPYSLLVFTF